MKNIISIPGRIAEALQRHLFQSELEQGAFLFARPISCLDGLDLVVERHYLVPPRGWRVQMDVYLEMKDSERGKIMKLARDNNLAAIDCHSHPHAGRDVWFSPSDRAGIVEFAQYAKWKLDGKPFAAMVWGEQSVDAIVFCGDFASAQRVDEVQILGSGAKALTPTGSWFRPAIETTRFSFYD